MKLIYIASAKSIHSLRWIKYFAKKYNIIWITTTQPNNETIEEFKELNRSTKIIVFKKLQNIFKTFKIFLFEEHYIVHLHYLGWHSLLVLLMRPKAKLILTPWGSDLLTNKYFLKKIWLRFLHKKSSQIICDSERLKYESIKLGANKNNISVNMFGIDTEIYKAKATIFSNPNEIIIGSNRKLEKIYDVKTLLNTAKSICNKISNITFLIAGDGSLKEEFEKFITYEKLNNKIYLLGLLNKNEMIKFYNSIDVYVSTSLSDGGLSSSIAEAMSFQRLVIVTDNSDNRLWINNKTNGYLFKNKNSMELEDIILKIIQNKERNLLIAKSARKIININFSYRKEMDKVDKIYKKFFK